jgi:hypothetical protein
MAHAGAAMPKLFYCYDVGQMRAIAFGMQDSDRQTDVFVAECR